MKKIISCIIFISCLGFLSAQTSSPVVGTFTACNQGDKSCDSKTFKSDGTLHVRIAALSRKKITFELAKCSGTFTDAGTMTIYTGSLCGNLVRVANYSSGASGITTTFEHKVEAGPLGAVSQAFYVAITGIAGGTQYAGPFEITIPPAEAGLTVIVHGFQLDGDIPDREVDLLDMAKAIQSESSDMAKEATIYKNNPKNGKWEYISGSKDQTKEIILLYNWAAISNNLSDGWLEAAADNLFAMIQTPPSDLNLSVSLLSKKKHFIGHSRGCILLLQLCHRIKTYFPNNSVEHLTLLDPHPATPMNDVSTTDETLSLPCIYGKPTGCGILYCSGIGNLSIKLPENVTKADAYYQQDGIYEGIISTANRGIDVASFDGISTSGLGTFDRKTNYCIISTGGSAAGGAHSDIHKWYRGTIDIGMTPNNTGWYTIQAGICPNVTKVGAFMTNETRSTTGYYYSRVRGHLSETEIPNVAASDKTTLADMNARIKKRTGSNLNPIFNGNFQYGEAGWTSNGSTKLNGITNFGYARLGKYISGTASSSNETLMHSYMYFPNYEFLCFSARCDNMFTTQKANLRVRFYDNKGIEIGSYAVKGADIAKSDYTHFYCPLPKQTKKSAALGGKIGTFSIEAFPYDDKVSLIYTGVNGIDIIVDDFLLSNKVTETDILLPSGLRENDPNRIIATARTTDYSNFKALYRDSSDNNFTNLSNNAWYKNYAQDGAGYGLFEANTYNNFDANEVLTRGEATSIIVNSALKLGVLRGGNLNINTTDGIFTDVPEDHKYFPYIQALRNLGYLNINATNTFKPDENLTLGQFCKLLSLTYWDNTPSDTTKPNVHTTSQFNVQLAANTNPDFVPHIYRILNTFTLKTRGNKRWVERIFNFKVNAANTGYDNTVDANVVLNRVSMVKAMTNVFEFRRQELAQKNNVTQYVTVGEKWELPEAVTGNDPAITTITTADFTMTAGVSQAFVVNTNINNPHYYWSINGGKLKANNTDFNNVTFTAPNVKTPTTFNLYVYAGSTEGSSIEFVKNIIVNPVKPATNLIASKTDTRTVQISWEDNETVETGYLLEYSLGQSGSFQELIQLNTNITSYSHTKLPTNTNVFYRVKTLVNDASSLYSNIGSVISDINTTKTVTQLEYFIDTDPGFGLGTSVTITTGRSITANFTAPLTGLSEGMHRLYVRAKDNANNWSNVYERLFIKTIGKGGDLTMEKVEYFFDTDPGFGNGTSVTPSEDKQSIDYSFAADVSDLPEGLHVAHVRAKDSGGKWSNTHTQAFLKTTGLGGALGIEKIEYFFDTDPGFGSGFDATFTKNQMTYNFNATVSGLSNGAHVMYMRARDRSGKWSNMHAQIFLKTIGKGGDLKMEKIEYFFDTDPGFGSGTSVALTEAQTIDFTFAANVASLSEGVHVMHIRAKDNGGNWSSVHAQAFLKTTGVGGILRLEEIEYFIDEEPGFGHGTSVPISDIGNFRHRSVDLVVNLANIPDGVHMLYLRGKDTNGKWSNVFSRPFLRLQGIGGNLAITKVEYFIDTEPGLGLGTDVPITSATSVDHQFSADLSTVTNGVHTLYVRARDNSGRWSSIFIRPFVKLMGENGQPVITQIEYFFDTDPGFGNGTAIAVIPNASVNISRNISLAALSTGKHRLYIRAKDGNERWSHIFYDTVHVNPTWVVPVELSEFTVQLVKNDGLLKWVTQFEKNTNVFEIERSIDATKFNKIGEVKGSGNSNSVKNYTFTDKLLEGNQIYYYRLKIVDLDGSSTYSEIKSLYLVNEKKFSATIFPNPNDGVFSVILKGSIDIKLPVNVSIIDLQGKSILSLNNLPILSDNMFNIDLKDIATGAYYLIIRNGAQLISQQVVKY